MELDGKAIYAPHAQEKDWERAQGGKEERAVVRARREPEEEHSGLFVGP